MSASELKYEHYEQLRQMILHVATHCRTTLPYSYPKRLEELYPKIDPTGRVVADEPWVEKVRKVCNLSLWLLTEQKPDLADWLSGRQQDWGDPPIIIEWLKEVLAELPAPREAEEVADAEAWERAQEADCESQIVADAEAGINGVELVFDGDRDALLERAFDAEDGCVSAGGTVAEADYMSDRIADLEDLLRSARTICERQGADTNWKLFDEQIAKRGIGSVTAKVFKVPRDEHAEADAESDDKSDHSQLETALRSCLAELKWFAKVGRATPNSSVQQAIDQAEAALRSRES